jgi:hypothetical protein
LSLAPMRIFSCVLLHAYSPCVRDKPAVVLRMGVPHREGLDTHAGLESCVTILPNSDTFSFRLLEGVCVNATASSRLPAVSRPPPRDKNKTVCLCLKSVQNMARIARVVLDCRITNVVRTLLGRYGKISIVFNASHSHMPGFRRNT